MLPAICAGVSSCVLLLFRFKARARRRRDVADPSPLPEMSTAQMLLQLEKSASAPATEKVVSPVAASVEPAVTPPVPPLPISSAAPGVVAEKASPPVAAATATPAPTAAIPTPAAGKTPVPTPSGAAVPVAPPKPAEAKPRKTPEKSKAARGLDWLVSKTKGARAPRLADLLQDETGVPEKSGFLRAVASYLVLEVPGFVLDCTPGLTAPPQGLPREVSKKLLRTAVDGEAKGLEPLPRAEVMASVVKSMVCELVENAVEMKSAPEKAEAMDGMLTFAMAADALFDALAPDVELGFVTYEGPLKKSRLESLYTAYLGKNSGMGDTSALLESMMGASDPTAIEQMAEQMQSDAEGQTQDSERMQRILASILKIPERRQERLQQDQAAQLMGPLMESLKGLA